MEYRNDYYQRLKLKLDALDVDQLERFFKPSILAAPFIVMDWERSKGKLSIRSLAVRYNIPRSTVHQIIERHKIK